MILALLDVDTLSSDFEVQAWGAKLSGSVDAGGCGIGVSMGQINAMSKPAWCKGTLDRSPATQSCFLI